MTRHDYAGADENLVPNVYREAVFVSSNDRLDLYLWVAEWTLHSVTPCVDPMKYLMPQSTPVRPPVSLLRKNRIRPIL